MLDGASGRQHTLPMRQRLSTIVVSAIASVSLLVPSTAIAAPLAAPQGDVAAPAKPRPGVIGRVAFGNADVTGAKVRITDDRTGAVLGTATTNRDGFFLVSNIARGTRVEVIATGGSESGNAIRGSLRADHLVGEPTFAWVTAETTVLAGLHDRMPGLSAKAAYTRTRAALGLPLHHNRTFGPEHSRHHSTVMGSAVLFTAAQKAGGLDALLKARTALAVKGKAGSAFTVHTVNGLQPRTLTPRGWTSTLGTGLLNGALGAVGSLALGWFLSAIGVPTAQETQIQDDFNQMESQLNQMTQDIDNLSSEVANMQSQMETGFSQIEEQLNQIWQSIQVSQYQSTYNDALTAGSPAATHLAAIQGLMSLAASNPDDAASIMSQGQDLLNNLADGDNPPPAQFAQLTNDITGDGAGSIYAQLSDVLTGPTSNVLNANGSAALQNAYAYWNPLVVQSFYVALEVAHAENMPAGPIASSYTSATSLTAPTPLPPNTALQIANFGSSGDSVPSGSGLMYVTDLVDQLTAPGPTGPTWAGSPLTATMTAPGYLPGSISANGQTVGNWFLASAGDMTQLATFGAVGSNPMTGIPALLGLSSTYASALNTNGFWDNTQACVPVNNGGSFLPTTVNGYVGCTNPTTGQPSSNAYWIAARFEPNPGQYLPAA